MLALVSPVALVTTGTQDKDPQFQDCLSKKRTPLTTLTLTVICESVNFHSSLLLEGGIILSIIFSAPAQKRHRWRCRIGDSHIKRSEKKQKGVRAKSHRSSIF